MFMLFFADVSIFARPSSVPGSKTKAKQHLKKLGKSSKYWEKPLTNYLFFGLIFEPETLETQSRALKTCILT